MTEDDILDQEILELFLSFGKRAVRASGYMLVMNCPHFRPDTQHKQEGSSMCLRISLCLTSIDRLN